MTARAKEAAMRHEHPGRVIVGIDGSVAGLRALRLAVDEARRRKAPLHAIRVWNVDPRFCAGYGIAYDDYKQDAAETIRATFAATLGGVPEDIEVVCQTVVAPPWKGLVDYASRDADVLFVGTRQRGWLRRMFRRSVARWCVAHAHCPVVVVPPDTFARAASGRDLVRALNRDLAEWGG
jgi:nucleotide-binding universal stress UspA family protein